MSVSDLPQPGERMVQANGLTLACEAFGAPADEPLVLITGLGMQMLFWPVEFCESLAARGFHVIRFDNRDTGLSTKIVDGPRPNVIAAYAGDTSSASYTLEDMADDTAGLLDALDIDAAHIVGISLGGMIAQTLAIAHPQRVRSMASMLSTTGSKLVGLRRIPGLRDLRVFVALFKRPPDPEGYIEHVEGIFRIAGSNLDEEERTEIRAMLRASAERCHYPAASPRQLLAILASGDRAEALRHVEVPTLVVQGGRDVLMPVSAGRATARAIPDALYLEIPEMGHDLPRAEWPTLIDAIVANSKRAVPLA